MRGKRVMANQTKADENLFEERSNGSVSAVTAVFFVLSSILLFGGVLVMSWAFTVDEWALELFSGGLLMMTLGLILPFNILPAMGK